MSQLGKDLIKSVSASIEMVTLREELAALQRNAEALLEALDIESTAQPGYVHALSVTLVKRTADNLRRELARQSARRKGERP